MQAQSLHYKSPSLQSAASDARAGLHWSTAEVKVLHMWLTCMCHCLLANSFISALWQS